MRSFFKLEKKLRDGIVPDVAGTAHRAGDAMVGHQPLEMLAGVLGVFNRSSQDWVIGQILDIQGFSWCVSTKRFPGSVVSA